MKIEESRRGMLRRNARVYGFVVVDGPRPVRIHVDHPPNAVLHHHRVIVDDFFALENHVKLLGHGWQCCECCDHVLFVAIARQERQQNEVSASGLTQSTSSDKKTQA